MKHGFKIGTLIILSTAVLTAGFGCSGGDDEGQTVPITTTSVKARELYNKGRDLAENDRNQESIEYFEKALELDPNFAMAHIRLAFTAATTGDFLEHYNAALARVDSVSEGERLWILGVQAAVNGDPALQQQLIGQSTFAVINVRNDAEVANKP